MQDQTASILIKTKKDLSIKISVTVIVAIAIAVAIFQFNVYREHLEAMLVVLGILAVFYVDMFLVKKKMLAEILSSNSEQKKLILDVKEQVKNIDDTKAEFVSLAIHQLRAPLTGIRWALKMIIDGETGPISAELKNMLVRTYDSSVKSLTVLNELINIDRVEPTKLRYNFESIDIVPLVQAAVQNVDPQAQDNKVLVTFNHPDITSSIVKADREKMMTVIENILENSIKYTIGRGVVNVSLKEEDGNTIIAIKDNGIGIPLKDQPNVFKKFFRAHNALEMRMQGSGVGLFMVKNIVEKHDGKIWFESEEGGGTTFFVAIPLA